MIGQAADSWRTGACLLLVTNRFLSLKAFRSSINIAFNSLSKRATNLLVAGLL